MKQYLFLLFLALTCNLYGQETLLKPGNRFPDILIKELSNAPTKEFYLNRDGKKSYYILNFWGTWCSPCIPEMDSLAIYQKLFNDKIQVIAISDDDENRKAAFLKKRPSGIWLATDTAYTLYNMLNLAYVGQSVIIGPDKKIVSVVRTDSINRFLLNRLLKGDKIPVSAGFKEIGISTKGDPFGIDSLTTHSISIRGYKKGQRSMGQLYFEGPFKHRRATWYNASIGLLYRAAYGIKTYQQQEFYDASVKPEEINNHNLKDTSALYCVDILVAEHQKDSLYQMLQKFLPMYLPVKARSERRMIPVYVLKRITDGTNSLPVSVAKESSYSFSGRGYNGIKVTLANFASDYLSNELTLPVVDETGLNGFFDIKTEVSVRDIENIKQSIEKLGLKVEKTTREMNVIVYYK